jgi:uncharacterized protein (DUF305 family)
VFSKRWEVAQLVRRDSVRKLEMDRFVLKLRICFPWKPTSEAGTPKVAMKVALGLALLGVGIGAGFCGPVLGAQQPGADSGTWSAPVVVQPGAPGEASKRLPTDARPTLPPLSAADVEFMQGMIMHHSQAVEMTALIESHTGNKDVRALGAKISSSQADEIRMMRRWLAARGQATSMSMPGMPDMGMDGRPMPMMPGMLTPEQMTALKSARGAEFDRLFLSGMMQHHGGALVMVKDLFDTAGAGQDADIFDFATDVDNTQRAEIKIMQKMLEERP